MRGDVYFDGNKFDIPTVYKIDNDNPLGGKNISSGGKNELGDGKSVESKVEQDNKLVAKVTKELDLPTRIGKSGMNNRQAGEFFGWEAGRNSKTVTDFTKEMLIKNGWTKEVLESVAEAYTKIAEFALRNPSAKLRAEQLKSLLTLF